MSDVDETKLWRLLTVIGLVASLKPDKGRSLNIVSQANEWAGREIKLAAVLATAFLTNDGSMT